MWLDAVMLYFWLLMWAPGPPMGPDHSFPTPDGQTVSSRAQGMDPNEANKALGPNGSHNEYVGKSGDAPPNNP